MSTKLIKSTLAAMVVAALATGGAMAQIEEPVDSSGNPVDASGTRVENSVGSQINEVEENQDRLYNQVGQPVTNPELATNQAGYADDSNITLRVKKAFDDDSIIDSSDITVNTDNGVVALSGFVDSTEKRTRAVQVARDVQGVKSVNDNLNIRTNSETTVGGYASDAAITTEIKAKLLTADDVPSMNISVETVDGVVQLTGHVDRQAQADIAERVAKQVEGVKTVKNDIAVRP